MDFRVIHYWLNWIEYLPTDSKSHTDNKRRILARAQIVICG